MDPWVGESLIRAELLKKPVSFEVESCGRFGGAALRQHPWRGHEDREEHHGGRDNGSHALLTFLSVRAATNLRPGTAEPRTGERDSGERDESKPVASAMRAGER